MDFTVSVNQIRTESLRLDYNLVPWDTEILGFAVAEIRRIELSNGAGAESDFQAFASWCRKNDIRLCSCRIPHSHLRESELLQAFGFRFIELNYAPEFIGLSEFHSLENTLKIVPATPGDQQALTEMASEVFQHGRFHQDPRLGSKLGDKRYGIWMQNSFSRHQQYVFKCMDQNKIVAFFVVEYPASDQCHWSLIGLAPEMAGMGLGTRAWTCMLGFNQSQGMKKITTSISSHNTAVLNLYVKLGFRFPEPNVTFHWMP